MTRHIILLTLMSMLVFTGCIKEDDLVFSHVEDLSVSIGSITAVDAVIVVENKSSRNVKISDAMFYVTDTDNHEIGTVTVADELHLPKKSVTSLAVPLRIRLSDPLFGLGMLSNIEENAERMVVNGNVRVRAGLLKKNFKVKNMPLSEFLSIFTAI